MRECVAATDSLRPKQIIAEHFDATLFDDNCGRYNVAPTQSVQLCGPPRGLTSLRAFVVRPSQCHADVVFPSLKSPHELAIRAP
jgi:hypothetical protein